jgi:hypothetical protein
VTHAKLLRAQLAVVHDDPEGVAFAARCERMRRWIAELPYGWASHVARPVIELGDDRLAFRIGLARADQPTQRTVQIWAARHHLTAFDDTAYVPQFVHSLRHELDIDRPPPAVTDPVSTHRHLASDDTDRVRWSYRWLSLGPTTDGLTSFAWRDGDDAVATFALPGAEPFAIRIPATELDALLRRVIAILELGR